MRYFLQQLKFVKWKDIGALFVFILALPISWIYRCKRKNLWLVCERAAEARDNGYWFFRYMRLQHPEQDCVYAIKRCSPDYAKVAQLGGQIIEFGSLRHWVYYLTARINISSQKEGKPNAAVCHLLEIYGLRKNKRVYLKHGIVKNDLKWHYYQSTKMWLYICSAKRELEYCQATFGYPEGSMALTGLCRFDNLDTLSTDPKTVCIMPTSREWLARPIKEYSQYDRIDDFSQTEYFKAWRDVLINDDFNRCVRENGLDVIFFLHPNMQKYAAHFEGLPTTARILCTKDIDLQQMLKKAAVFITDYSSTCFDFAYMRKPLLYYQFDYEKFRKGHYQEGYFSYRDDGFGPVCQTANELVSAFCQTVQSGSVLAPEYDKRVSEFFAFFDQNNCERTYQAIMERYRSGI